MEKQNLISTNNMQYITFLLNDEAFAIQVNEIREVIKSFNITRIPHITEDIYGIINLRGDIIPVLDLSHRFYNKKTELNKFSSILIFDLLDDGIKLGILVDEIKSVINFSLISIIEKPNFGTKIRNDFIDKFGKLENEIIILLNTINILNLEELSEIYINDNNRFINQSDEIFSIKPKKILEKKETLEDVIQDNYLVFKVKNEFYAIKSSNVLNLIMSKKITKVPNSKLFMAGIIQFYEKIITVVDMRIKCGYESKEYDDRTGIILLNFNDIVIGLAVDQLIGIRAIEDKNIKEVYNYTLEISEDFVEGVSEYNNELLIILDTSKLLSDDEIVDISNQEIPDNN